MNQARIVIAGTGSGVGKTSVTLGIVAALRKRGLKVAPFKVGPDYLDPTWLRLAAQRECYNLEGWMCDDSYIKSLFYEQLLFNFFRLIPRQDNFLQAHFFRYKIQSV